MTIDKEVKYLRLAEHFAQSLSKDKSTQVGAFFLHPSEYTILTMGYNGIPRGCDDNEPSRHERPLKYSYFEHAERNAIYNAVRSSFRDCVVHCNVPLEVDDIRAIISVGADILRAPALPEGDTARQLLAEANVQWLPPVPNSTPDMVTFVTYTGKYLASASLVGGGIVPTESAVRRAIFEAARPLLDGSTAIVGPLPPCAQCASAIAAVGSRRVVTNRPSAEHEQRWGTSFMQTRSLFSSLGIDMVET